MTLSSMEFKARYQKPDDDIAMFYRKCYTGSISYDRLTGYFSSAVYVLLWAEVSEFVNRGGKMRLICSPVQSRDADAIEIGYRARTDDDLARELRQEFDEMIRQPGLTRPAMALAGLISEGHLEIRIAAISANANAAAIRMVHDKTGVFTDRDGNSLSFSGSMNETFLGVSRDGNIESIDVFPNWMPDARRDALRTQEIQSTFDRIWANEMPGVLTTELPGEFCRALDEVHKSSGSWRVLIDEIVGESESNHQEAIEQSQLRPHQIAALRIWRDGNHRGILEHATGSGKTITAIEAIKEAHENNLVALVIVPSRDLVRQWTSELKSRIGCEVQACDSSGPQWRERLRGWYAASKPIVVVATGATARDPQFIYRTRQVEDRLFMVVDEVHFAGSSMTRDIFRIQAEWRLGLSATPTRHGDAEGTQALLNFFEGVVDKYSLGDAIRDGYLVEYDYFPTIVQLDHDENEEWQRLTRRIGIAINEIGSLSKAMSDPDVRKMIMRRARIAKKASAKYEVVADILRKCASPGQRWLVYVEDGEMLDDVSLRVRNMDLDLDLFEYHSKMTGDREATLRLFSDIGGIVLSMKCLDEGVDIPLASHALIASSSQNPRQFIQRCGRVLRRPPGGDKGTASIYDVLVVPRAPFDVQSDSLTASELSRSFEFCESAKNRAIARLSLLRQFDTLGIDISKVVQVLEVDVDEEMGEM